MHALKNEITGSLFGFSPAQLVSRLFTWIDATRFGRFVRERSQSFVAINSSIADIGYILYAFTSGETISRILVCGMACKISGSTILIADDRKGAAASREKSWPSKLVLCLHHGAKRVTQPVHRLILSRFEKRLPNAFTAALSLYALNGLTYIVNGSQGLMHHFAFTHLSQTLSGCTMVLGGLSFALSGLEINKGARETIWSKRGQLCYAITPVFCIFNLIASVAAGQLLRSLALALVTSMAIFQIYVRHNFKRQRDVPALAE